MVYGLVTAIAEIGAYLPVHGMSKLRREESRLCQVYGNNYFIRGF